MARTALFSRVRRLLGAALSAPPSLSAAERGLGLGRRELLLAAATGTIVSCAARGKDPADSEAPRSASVAVVGGGLAGLLCGYWLAEAGVDVTVYEASRRIGGRTFTARDVLPGGLSCELGGEFIDSSHATIHWLAAELGLTLDDRHADDPEASDPQIWWVNGRRVLERTLLEQLTVEKRSAFEQALRTAEQDPGQLDATPLSVWLEGNLGSTPELLAILTTAYRGEFGLEPDEQSALNLVYLADFDAAKLPEFGKSAARYTVREGSSAFAEALADELGDRVRTDRRLVALEQNGDAGYTLTFETEERTGVQAQAARVVLALPFSVLRHVDIARAGLSEQKREIITNLGYGTSVKIVGAFATRSWRELYEESGSVTSDLPFQQVWDGSGTQPGPSGVLTNFLGGEAGVDSAEGTAEAQMTAMLSDLNPIFPNVSITYIEGSAIRMHWPSAPLFRGSYSCHRFGQWPYTRKEGEPEGRLYFCGEHCSVDFRASMEGAAETGVLTAVGIIQELGLDIPEALFDLMLVKTAVPQPCYRFGTAPALGPVTRRRAVLREQTAFVLARRLRLS